MVQTSNKSGREIDVKTRASIDTIQVKDISYFRRNQENYCPVVTFDGVTPNPTYASKPIRY